MHILRLEPWATWVFPFLFLFLFQTWEVGGWVDELVVGLGLGFRVSQIWLQVKEKLIKIQDPY
jgi:hypothetical protein